MADFSDRELSTAGRHSKSTVKKSGLKLNRCFHLWRRATRVDGLFVFLSRECDEHPNLSSLSRLIDHQQSDGTGDAMGEANQTDFERRRAALAAFDDKLHGKYCIPRNEANFD